ncbi:LacI family DNA-binding transcriptional regulator [Paenibacillus aurantius]|uniref:LacI family DNA-binding transcriptional regulator n=1 Tax=Paenibacillus aurantius TaxID=2918900 RepID=A0AA96RCY5_9BACL|nr:LacI family DNA-binding transcriptional regulator [Paenibacillus aurantius]WNQ08921.1 LacI family DNA-binding transcriptional regulator [Paenibacillus aurantius]
MKIEDIAKLAGVSKAAVSLALNGKPGIGAETRERILQIARESGYMPKSKSSETGPQKSLVFLAFTNSGIVLEEYYRQPFFRELIQHTEERCRSKGFSLLFRSVNMESFEQEIELVASEHRESGVILLGTNLSRPEIESISRKLPHLVVLDTSFETLPVHFVQINNGMGAYQAGSSLCRMGHTEIGYVASSVRINNFNDRRRGFETALAENGMSLAEKDVFTCSPTVLTSQPSLADQFAAYRKRQGRLPGALFCECDYIAISAIKTLTELGVRIPEEISVIGFDNISEAVIVSPELTTIHVEKERMAQLAVDLLVQTLEDPSLARVKTLVDTTYVERQSCRPPEVRTALNVNH